MSGQTVFIYYPGEDYRCNVDSAIDYYSLQYNLYFLFPEIMFIMGTEAHTKDLFLALVLIITKYYSVWDRQWVTSKDALS